MRNGRLYKIIILLIFFISAAGMVIFITLSDSNNQEEIKSITISEENYGESGTWSITKSSEWTSKSTVYETINVNSILKEDSGSRDVILVIDASSTISEEEISSLKDGINELIEKILENDGNKVSLIKFSDNALTMIDFIDDKNTLKELVNNLTFNGVHNYNAGLKCIDEDLENYIYDENKELVTLFITTGKPNMDIPNQVSTYESLKDEYSYMTINGIQYGIGDSIISELKKVSDNQWSSDIDDIDDVLLEAGLSPAVYEEYTIRNYIDKNYFTIDSIDDVSVTNGNVLLENDGDYQVVVWNMDSSYITGTEESMTLNIKLKDKYISTYGYYSTTDNINIKSKLSGEDEISLTSGTSPVLTNQFKVTYDTNTPEGCTIDSIASETYFIYDSVAMKDDLSCDGYTFDGWDIAEDVEYINDKTFIMPSYDITVKAIWSSIDITKSMDGTVYKKETLYDAAVRLGTKYEGSVTDTFNNTVEATNVYTYSGDGTTNNVIFGGFCWQIIRTTETGGVKLIYNGVPENGDCTATGEDATIGTTLYNENNKSAADVGYMYNTIYESSDINYFVWQYTIFNSTALSSSYYYSDTYTYGTVSNSTQKQYTLTDAKKISGLADIQELVGKYTLLKTSSDGTSKEIYYIVGVTDTTLYYLKLYSGSSLSTYNKTYYFYDDANYSNETTAKKSDWFEHYSEYVGKYFCTYKKCSNPYYILKNDNQYYFAYYYKFENMLIGDSITYDDSTGLYTLNNTVVVTHENYADFTIYGDGDIYTCLSTSNTCSKVYYISELSLKLHESDDIDYAWFAYLGLDGGKTIDTVLNEMLYADGVNATDSTIKTYVDSWYAKSLTDYTRYLEDVVYCNDRSIKSYKYWYTYEDENEVYKYYYPVIFNNFSDSGATGTNYVNTNDLSCSNVTDQFSVSNSNAKLTYPVGLITAQELYKMSNFRLEKWNWTLSPFSATEVGILTTTTVYKNEKIIGGLASDNDIYVRPVISLKSDIEYITGDGSKENPFIVDAS